MKTLTVVPAYGRDYKSAAAAVADWDANKDFQVATLQSRFHGSYVSKGDLKNYPSGYTHVNLRYKKMERVAVIKL